MRQYVNSSEFKITGLILPLGIVFAVGLGWLTAINGVIVPAILIALIFIIPLIAISFISPKKGVIVLIGYCFFYALFAREVGSIPYGLAIDGLLIITWLGVLFHNSLSVNQRDLKNDLCTLSLIWFVYNFLQLANPAGASPMGWFQESRSSAFYWFMAVPLFTILFNKRRDLDIFLIIIIGISVLAALNGVRQLYVGFTPGEQAFLSGPGGVTHMLWGKLRVFSFYGDAAQFGSSQAHVGLIALILALGPFEKWKRILFAIAACILLYGMLISGTRGAFFVLAIGTVITLVLTKNVKALAAGSVFALLVFCFLKFTTIGNTNYEIYRFRSALDPTDASLSVRFQNQSILRDYLSTRPFGGGVGSIGFFAHEYNSGKFLTAIPPDSYWVKIWASYGIVGLIVWLGIMMFIIGKSCGIVWNIKDKRLKTKLMALTAGAAGIVCCSYGNEIINIMPSSIIVYGSWAIVFLGSKLDRQVDGKSYI